MLILTAGMGISISLLVLLAALPPALAGRGVLLVGCLPWVLFYLVISRRVHHRAECPLTRFR